MGMARNCHAAAVVVAALAAMPTARAAAEVRDAVYRGTLICEKLPFTNTPMRAAIDVTIADGKVTYRHVVRLRRAPEAVAEQGTGTLNGQDISLQGAWDSGGHRYKANYSGTFVRRSARLKGTQTWTVGGKDVQRACSGVVKRPLRAFLPRKKKP
jgi:hypothetical protein